MHFIGIGGVSMSALAMLYRSNGYTVTGSDLCRNNFTDELIAAGIQVFIGHSAKNVKGSSLVVKNAAIPDDNPEVLAAKAAVIPIKDRAEVLGLAAARFDKCIAVSGTHGKTTCSGMAAAILTAAGFDPSAHIGGLMQDTGSQYILGGGRLFVTEACEYCRSFLHISPDTAVILNAAMDHPDCYKDLSDVQRAFRRFLFKVKPGGAAVINADDRNSEMLMCAPPCEIVTFGIKSGEIRARHIKRVNGRFSFDIYEKGKRLCRVTLKVFGKHNIYNALAAAAASIRHGAGADAIKAGLEGFSGMKRRFEYWGGISGAEVYHDYAHHPQEIAATLKAAKALKRRPVICVFQPHTYSRTQRLFNEFITVLKKPDAVIMPEIYAARERPIEGVTSAAVCACLRKTGRNAQAYESFADTAAAVKAAAKSGALILILGAGDIENLKADLWKD